MYTTQAKIEALTGTTLTTSQLAALTDVISAVTAFIENYVGKTFEGFRDTRYYDGNGCRELMIDSFTTASMGVEILNINGSTQKTLSRGHANDYIVAPYNRAEKNQLILTRNGSYGSFPSGRHRVRVSANFGASLGVPADISMVATKLSYELLRTDKPDGTISTSVRLGDYSATYQLLEEKSQALGTTTVLDSYREIEI